MFFFLRQDLFGENASDDLTGPMPDRMWLSGAPIEPIGPTVVGLQPGPGGLPDLFDVTMPVMSAALLAVLHAQGVDTLQTFPITLKRTTGATVDSYSAVNVTAQVDALDRERSEFRLRRGKPKCTGPVFLDAAKVGALRLFRLPSPGLMVITKPVADAVKAAKLAHVLVQPTEDYSGD